MKPDFDILKLTTSQFILDWDYIRKGKMIGYVSIFIACWDLFIAAVVHYGFKFLNVPAAHRLAESGLKFIYTFGCSYIALCMLLIFFGNKLENQANHSKTNLYKTNYMYCCMLLYTGGNVIVSHMFGELSMASGIMMAGAPIIGWILFNNTGVIVSFAFAFAVSLPLFFLSFFGIIDYAPIVEQNSSSLHHNMAYNVLLISVVIPHLIALLVMAYLSISHWRQREEHANYLAGTDSLTNVPNRRQFFMHLHNAIEEVSITAQPISVLMLDLDNFKYINDNFGHITGDDVLNQTIQTLKSCLRENDIIGRFGGDEFVVLLPNTNSTIAEKIALRCLDVVRSTPVKTEQGLFNITASFGMTTLYEALPPLDLETLSRELIIKADDALYRAKQKGRDCLVVAA